MEKKIILKNEREYKCEDVRIANKEIYKKRFLVPFIIYIIGISLLGGLFIGLSFSNNNDITFIGTGIICFSMALICLCFYVIIYFKIKKTNYKNVNYKYTFYDDELVVSVNSEATTKHQSIKYKNIIKCIKSNNYTFIYFNKAQAYFFLNDDLNVEVYNLLKNNVKKYKD